MKHSSKPDNLIVSASAISFAECSNACRCNMSADAAADDPEMQAILEDPGLDAAERARKKQSLINARILAHLGDDAEDVRIYFKSVRVPCCAQLRNWLIMAPRSRKDISTM